MRKRFDDELRHLNDLVLEMASLNESAIKKAISLLDEKDKDIAEEVIQDEKRTDQYEKIIQDQCLKIFVEQQPAASDLRRVSSALKMITDLERIGDNARDIAEICMGLADDGDTTSPPDMERADFFKSSFTSSQIAACLSDDSTISSSSALFFIPWVFGP